MTMALGFQSCELSGMDVSFGDHLSNAHEGRERVVRVVVLLLLLLLFLAAPGLSHNT